MKSLKVTTKATDAMSNRIDDLRRYQPAHDNHSAGADLDRRRLGDALMARVAVIDPMADDIEKALKATNGRASAFCVTTFDEVESIARRAEKMLESVNQANRPAATVEYYPAGPSANAYKYSAKSTRITLRRVADGWRLTGIIEDICYPKGAERLHVTISAAAAADITRHSMAGLTVREEVAA